MKERGVLFSAPMVLALLAGRKTQTRRIIKPQPMVSGPPDFWRESLRPYAEVGSRLWVRETWGYRGMGHKNYGPKGRRAECYLHYAADDSKRTLYAPDESAWTKLPKQKPAEPLPRGLSEGEIFDAQCRRDEYVTSYWRQWRPSIFMPRWASRITLEVTGVRVERLQDISEEDARAEGVARLYGRDVPVAMGGGIETWVNYEEEDNWHTSARASFGSLWRSINGAESWAADPWCWAISFKRLESAKGPR